MRRHLAALALTAALGACSQPEALPKGVYKIGLTEAYQRLLGSDLPDFAFARQCGILIHIQPEGVEGRFVTWRVMSSGEEQLNFTATLTPVAADQTKVDVSVSPGENGHEAYDGSQFYSRPALGAPVRPAVEEAVAALMEGRKFDIQRVGPPKDTVCLVQRGGLESGVHFGIHDKPGMDSDETARARRGGF